MTHKDGPTLTILIFIMTLGILKITCKFEPYNPIIQLFIIEIVNFFGLKVEFLTFCRLLAVWISSGS